MHLKHINVSLSERFDVQTLTMDDLQKHVKVSRAESESRAFFLHSCPPWPIDSGDLPESFAGVEQ
jgi:hypothetical protein